jgi:antitoxin component of MazEF toxin-antitoxin module
MEINLMPVVNIRPKGQVTIPAEILKAWQIHTNDKINVNLVNGVVMLTPVNRRGQKKSIMSYAGIARGLWGDSADAIDGFIRNERDTWEK